MFLGQPFKEQQEDTTTSDYIRRDGVKRVLPFFLFFRAHAIEEALRTCLTFDHGALQMLLNTTTT